MGMGLFWGWMGLEFGMVRVNSQGLFHWNSEGLFERKVDNVCLWLKDMSFPKPYSVRTCTYRSSLGSCDVTVDKTLSKSHCCLFPLQLVLFVISL
jgi:hypothetical protein